MDDERYLTRAHDVEDIELSDPEFWALPADEREGAFATLREQAPVSFHEEFDFPGLPAGAGYHAVTRYEDVRAISRDPATFSSARGTSVPDFPAFLSQFFGSMLNMDDPEHAKLRQIVSGAFTPRRVSELNEKVDRKATKLVDRLLTLGGECDFVEQVAAPLPLEIICEMMGVNEAHWGRVLDLTNVVLSGGDPEYASGIGEIISAAAEMSEIGRETAKERQKRPTDDLVSAMVNADVNGEALTPGEFASFFILLAAAGNETTRNAISHGMKVLTENPEQRAILVNDLDRHMPTAVEEIVRWASPVISFRRTTTRPTTICGQAIGAGQKVVLFYNSANRDESVFTDPYHFDVTRTPNEHLGYGGGGVHFCLGANLARREISVVFRQLLTRVPTLQITGAPARLQSGFINGIKRMPCSF